MGNCCAWHLKSTFSHFLYALQFLVPTSKSVCVCLSRGGGNVMFATFILLLAQLSCLPLDIPVNRICEETWKNDVPISWEMERWNLLFFLFQLRTFGNWSAARSLLLKNVHREVPRSKNSIVLVVLLYVLVLILVLVFTNKSVRVIWNNSIRAFATCLSDVYSSTYSYIY